MLLKHIKKAFYRHPEAFHNYHIMASDIVSEIEDFELTLVEQAISVFYSRGSDKQIQSLESNHLIYKLS